MKYDEDGMEIPNTSHYTIDRHTTVSGSSSGTISIVSSLPGNDDILIINISDPNEAYRLGLDLKSVAWDIMDYIKNSNSSSSSNDK